MGVRDQSKQCHQMAFCVHDRVDIVRMELIIIASVECATPTQMYSAPFYSFYGRSSMFSTDNGCREMSKKGRQFEFFFYFHSIFFLFGDENEGTICICSVACG